MVIEKPKARLFITKFYSNLKDGLQPILLKLLKEIETEGALPNSFYKASIILISKPGKDTITKERKLQTNTPDENRFKILTKVLVN